MEREAGRCIGGQRISPLLCETQHWRREVDAHDLVTIRREDRGHPTSAAPDLEDRSPCLPGQSPVEVGVALHGAARDEARAQGVIYLGVQAVGFVKGTELRLLAHGSSVGSNRYRVKAFGHRAIEWGWDDAPVRPLLFLGDLPRRDQPLPKALADTEYVAESARLNRAGLAQLASALDALGMRYVPSHANFLLVHVGDAARVYEHLLRQGVIVRPVANYGLPAHLRVTVGLPEENRRFLTALESALAR